MNFYSFSASSHVLYIFTDNSKLNINRNRLFPADTFNALLQFSIESRSNKHKINTLNLDCVESSISNHYFIIDCLLSNMQYYSKKKIHNMEIFLSRFPQPDAVYIFCIVNKPFFLMARIQI